MRGKKARLIRKLVYPGDMSSRTRKYKTILYGQRIADQARRGYQRLKRACKGVPARMVIASAAAAN